MSRRKVIALMMGTAGLRADYQGLVRAGVERRCIENDIDLWIYSGRNDWRTTGPSEGLLYELVTRDNVDGIILLAGVIACFIDMNELLAKLRKCCDVPMCSVGLHLADVPSVTIDNRIGMESVVEHLVTAHGYKSVGFIAGPRGHEESEARLAATRTTLARVGRNLPDEAIAYGNFSLESGALAAKQLMTQGPALDAIVVANDDMAAGALQALVASGRRCPEDVALAGFDDAPSSRICTPALTTVRQPVFDLGVHAADCILAMWRGQVCPATTTLKTEAVLRESCGCDPLLGPMRVVSDAAKPLVAPERLGAIAELLNGLTGDLGKRLDWANQLWQALETAASGESDQLQSVIQRILDETAYSDAPIFDLLRVVSYLRKAWPSEADRLRLDETFHSALAQIGQAMHRREASRRLQDGFLMDELRLSWERLATTLSFDSLRDVLLRDLPRFFVNNAIVSIFPPGEFDTLVPLACLVDGEPVALEAKPFAANRLKPEEVPAVSGRCSFAVMPLTFEWEPLGVAMLELPVQDAYMVLREQIGSAIKTVRLHETLMRQQERLKLQAQLESQAATERLRTMGLIAGGVAHDLNNVLGPLVALPETMRRDLMANARDLPEHVLSDLDTLQEASQRAAHTIRDLMTLGHALDAPKETYDLNRVLENVRRPLSKLVECSEHSERVELNLSVTNEPLLVHVSREHLVRAVSNLVVNAADAMTAPGEIFVRVRQRKVIERLDGVEPVEPGHYAVIEVEDSGCGIPEENLQRVLEPFFSSKTQSATGGRGLGLAIVHQIVSQSRGYVHVTSRIGKGTTFALYLPLMTQGTPVESAPPISMVGGKERILVVDDERVQLRTAQRILRQLGYCVATAESGEAALEIFERDSIAEPYHLVILDMLMPGSLNGLETLKELRKRKPTQRAMMVSGYAPEQMSIEAKENGVGWLAKPYTPTALAQAVRNALGHIE